MSKLLTLTCPICQKTFHRYPSQIYKRGIGTTCSLACSREARKIAYGSRMKRAPNEIPEAKLLPELLRLASKLGRTPKQMDMNKLGEYSVGPYKRVFGSWTGAIKAAGLPFIDPPSWTIDQLSPENGGWLAGFTDGEGCFTISKESSRPISHSITPTLTFGLRADDSGPLNHIRHLWMLERQLATHKARKAVNPVCFLNIAGLSSQVFKVVPTFRRYPLRSKKHRDFEIFAQAVELLHRKAEDGRFHRRHTDEELSELLRLKAELSAIKKYNA